MLENPSRFDPAFFEVHLPEDLVDLAVARPLTSDRAKMPVWVDFPRELHEVLFPNLFPMDIEIA